MQKLKTLYVELGVRIFFLFIFLSSFVKEVYAYEGQQYGKLCSMILQELAGDLGSMFASIAGVGAVVASAMGGMKMAWSLVVVSIGAYLLQTYQEIWFNPCSG